MCGGLQAEYRESLGEDRTMIEFVNWSHLFLLEYRCLTEEKVVNRIEFCQYWIPVRR